MCGVEKWFYPQRQARRMFTKVKQQKLESTKCHATSLDLHTAEVIVCEVLVCTFWGEEEFCEENLSSSYKMLHQLFSPESKHSPLHT